MNSYLFKTQQTADLVSHCFFNPKKYGYYYVQRFYTKSYQAKFDQNKQWLIVWSSNIIYLTLTVHSDEQISVERLKINSLLKVQYHL